MAPENTFELEMTIAAMLHIRDGESLAQARAAFEAQGGRGVDLAEEIDVLVARIDLRKRLVSLLTDNDQMTRFMTAVVDARESLDDEAASIEPEEAIEQILEALGGRVDGDG
jgi:hypothetical protein